MDKLREENKGLREIVTKGACLNCGVPTVKDAIISTEEQQLRIENVQLKAEVSQVYLQLIMCSRIDIC